MFNDTIPLMREQHDGVRETITMLENSMNMDEVDGRTVFRHYKELVHRVREHVQLEQGVLSDGLSWPNVPEEIRKGHDDIKRMSNMFTCYSSSYTNESQITSDLKGFRMYTDAVIFYLKKKMKVEEDDLYTFIEGIR